jgi:uncharacterized protein involved in exopolysaccharide biosynthesis
MRRPAPNVRRPLGVIRRHAILVGIAVVAGLLAGAAAAALSPRTVTSTALVVLAPSSAGTASAAVLAGSDQVLAGALPSLSPAIALEALRGEVRVKSLTRDVLKVSASAGTVAQAEATANAVAASYIGYVSSESSPVGRVPARMLEPATRATGTAPRLPLPVGAVLGVVSGLLTGVFATLASSRMARGPL